MFFAGSGSEANEPAIKIAWAYHAQRGEPRRRKIISRQNAYHGSTIFASRLCGMPSMHAHLDTSHSGVLFADAPHYAAGAAIALEILQLLQEREIPAQVRRVGQRFQSGIRELTKFDSICHSRGIGLIAAIDPCADVESAKAFAPEIRAGKRLIDVAEQQGLLIRAVGDTIVLAPPLIIDEADVDELIDRLESSFGIWSTEMHTPT